MNVYTYRKGLGYDGDDEIPDTVVLSLDEAQQTLQTGLADLHQRLVFERANPVTLSAAEKTNVVNDLNKVLDQLYSMRITVNRALLMVDKEG